jgi:hypothetical protein
VGTLLERLRRQGQEGGPIRGQQPGSGFCAVAAAVEFAAAGRGQLGVQVVPRVRGWDGHQEVAADVADAVLDVPLLVRLADAAEMTGEGEVGLEAEELPGQAALVGSDEPGHSQFAVVVTDARRHAAEEGEGAGVAGVKGLGALAREQAAEAGIAVRQGEDEQGRLVADAGDDDLGAAEVALGGPGRVQQGHEHLGLGLLVGGDGGADDAGTASVVVLVAEAFKDATGGVALLGRGVAVVLQDLVDDGQEGAEGGLGPRPDLPEGRWLGVVDDLGDGAEVEAVLAAGLPQAQLAGDDAATDVGPEFHVE